MSEPTQAVTDPNQTSPDEIVRGPQRAMKLSPDNIEKAANEIGLPILELDEAMAGNWLADPELDFYMLVEVVFLGVYYDWMIAPEHQVHTVVTFTEDLKDNEFTAVHGY